MNIIIYIVAFCILTWCVCSNMDRLSKTILISYLSVWFIALIISMSGACGLHQPKESTVALLLAHVLTFFIGFKLVKIKNKCDIQILHSSLDEQLDALTSSKVFKVVLIAAFIYVSSMFAIFYQEVAVANALVDVRNDFYSGELLGSGFSFLNVYFLIPFQGFVLAIFGYMSFYKRNWIWGVSGVYIIMYSLLSAGRNEIVNILLILVFFALCVGKLSTTKKSKNYIVFVLMILATYFTMGLLTGNRSGIAQGNTTLSEGLSETNTHVIAYLGGPVVAFDHALNSNLLNECGGYQLGAMTFAAIDEIVFMGETVLRKIVETPPRARAISEIGIYLHDNYIDIGTPWRWNALYTSCLYYYLDFGIFGVLFLPFIFGILVRLSVKWVYQYRSFLMIVILSIVFYTLVNTFQRFFLYRMSQLLLLYVLYHYGKKKKYLNKVNQL